MTNPHLLCEHKQGNEETRMTDALPLAAFRVAPSVFLSTPEVLQRGEKHYTNEQLQPFNYGTENMSHVTYITFLFFSNVCPIPFCTVMFLTFVFIIQDNFLHLRDLQKI